MAVTAEKRDSLTGGSARRSKLCQVFHLLSLLRTSTTGLIDAPGSELLSQVVCAFSTVSPDTFLFTVFLGFPGLQRISHSLEHALVAKHGSSVAKRCSF